MCVTGVVLTTPVALILIAVELQCSHVGKELGIEKPFPQSDLPAVSAAGEAPVTVLLVNARREQEARIGEDLRMKMEIFPMQCQGILWHLSSRTVPGEVGAAVRVFAHLVAILGRHNHISATDAIQSNQWQNLPSVGGCGIAPDLMVSPL